MSERDWQRIDRWRRWRRLRALQTQRGQSCVHAILYQRSQFVDVERLSEDNDTGV